MLFVMFAVVLVTAGFDTTTHEHSKREAFKTYKNYDTNFIDEEETTLTMTATAYTAECDGCSGITRTGINLKDNRNKKVIAVDPNVIPLGSKVYVEGYGEAIAGDIGSAIKGNRIDLHVPTKSEAFEFGVREVEVTVLS